MRQALHKVTFAQEQCSALVLDGTTIREAAASAGIALDAPCGGLGTCGRCAVIVEGAVEPPTSDERTLLASDQLARGVRLACRARIAGDCAVYPLDDRPAQNTSKSLRILEAGEARDLVVEPPQARGIEGDKPLLGAVVDIGTTTVVAVIVNLETGERLGSASALNPQHPFGHDVMSRISHVAMHGPDSLRQPIVSAVQDLIAEALSALGFAVSRVREVAIAGNTTMIHLLLGVDPAPLGVAPYTPAFVSPVDRPAEELGLAGLADARVYIVPGISAFVGADITAGVLATGIAEQERTVLLVDLGTNGEMVLRTSRGLVGASTAAGPALEGASIAYGMRAEDGAVERVAVDAAGRLVIGTIGDAEPKGLCGSGLLDLIAVLLDAGLIDSTGRLRADVSHPLAARVFEQDGTRVFEVAAGVLLTQRDIRQVQLANAAIASGIDLLLSSQGLVADDVERLVIAGGFGYHVRASALVRMGMIPAEWAERVSFAGNTAVDGALIALLDSGARRRAEATALHVETIDLASHPDFQTRFVGAMSFPRPANPEGT